MKSDEIEFEISKHCVSSLQLAALLLQEDTSVTSPWRWTIIALHDAMYCMLVMKLSRTDAFGVYPDSVEKKAGEFYQKRLSSNSPEWEALSKEQDASKLADLNTLLNRANLKSGARIHKSVSSAKGSARHVTLLKKRRDMFVHADAFSLLTTDGELQKIAVGCISVFKEIIAMQSYRSHLVSDGELDALTDEIDELLKHRL